MDVRILRNVKTISMTALFGDTLIWNKFANFIRILYLEKTWVFRGRVVQKGVFQNFIIPERKLYFYTMC